MKKAFNTCFMNLWCRVRALFFVILSKYTCCFHIKLFFALISYCFYSPPHTDRSLKLSARTGKHIDTGARHAHDMRCGQILKYRLQAYKLLDVPPSGEETLMALQYSIPQACPWTRTRATLAESVRRMTRNSVAAYRLFPFTTESGYYQCTGCNRIYSMM